MMAEEFDLNKAIAGAKVITRDGRRIEHLQYFEECDHGEHSACISGVLLRWKNQGYCLMRWNRDGRTNFRWNRDDSPTDLFLDVTDDEIAIYKARIAELEASQGTGVRTQ